MNQGSWFWNRIDEKYRKLFAPVFETSLIILNDGDETLSYHRQGLWKVHQKIPSFERRLRHVGMNAIQTTHKNDIKIWKFRDANKQSLSDVGKIDGKKKKRKTDE
jgi:hypothetical protein